MPEIPNTYIAHTLPTGLNAISAMPPSYPPAPYMQPAISTSGDYDQRRTLRALIANFEQTMETTVFDTLHGHAGQTAAVHTRDAWNAIAHAIDAYIETHQDMQYDRIEADNQLSQERQQTRIAKDAAAHQREKRDDLEIQLAAANREIHAQSRTILAQQQQLQQPRPDTDDGAATSTN
jgi:hypothetical protein